VYAGLRLGRQTQEAEQENDKYTSFHKMGRKGTKKSGKNPPFLQQKYHSINAMPAWR
jgi:hypothetical protein